MPKVWIPRCGDGIRLAKPWSAELLAEHRNVKIIEAITGKVAKIDWQRNASSASSACTVSFAAGDELVFDRVYIRQGSDDYASVTFIVKDTADGMLVGQRFWVTVDDANRIEAETSSRKNPLGSFALKSYVTVWQGRADPTVLERAARAKLIALELCTMRATKHRARHGHVTAGGQTNVYRS